MKKDYLFRKVMEIFSRFQRGKVLDLGCGEGRYAEGLQKMCFEVTASDADRKRFQFHGSVAFEACDLSRALPFEPGAFDYVLFLEVIEHLYNPAHVISEVNRVLKRGGKLILSTPNILNIGSRFRFLFQGSFDFFREPTLDYAKCFPAAAENMHVVPWRYQDLEYLLAKNGFKVDLFSTDKEKSNFYLPYLLLMPVLFLQSKVEERRSKTRGSVDFTRINRILLSKAILLGRHLILECTNNLYHNIPL